MEHSLIELNHLPDEILMIILKKLYNFDVLYSLIGVNKRLDRIANDSIFTKNLALVRPSSLGLYKFTDTVLDRFCVEILPKIHHNIEWLDVESSSMERILLSINYPNLRGLGLYLLAPETARDLFTDESFLIRVFKSQISSLFIRINTCKEPTNSFRATNIFIYTQIFTMFNNLQCLNFTSTSIEQQLTFSVSASNVFSSTLLELHVAVHTINDCIYLLDGSFSQLNKFYVTICSIKVPALPVINNEKKLPNLKCFSLTHEWALLVYNEFLVPLLQRMSNLEELSLYLVNHNVPIIDGDNLKKNIINHMPRLNKFTFNIHSIIRLSSQVNLPLNEDIQNTLRNFNNNQIISCVDYFSKADTFHSRIYSYPYTFTYYNYITNNFPGGSFKCVRKISLYDERPFEHEFFLKIAQSFPLIEELCLHNLEPQKNDNIQWSTIKYSHLAKLDLIKTHENYVEQFLINTKTCLSHNVYTRVAYDSLERVTNNFTRDTTRVNCSKITFLFLHNKPELCSPYLKDYFPRARIYYKINEDFVRYV